MNKDDITSEIDKKIQLSSVASICKDDITDLIARYGDEFTSQQWIDLVNQDGHYLEIIPDEHIDLNLCYAAIKRSCWALEFVPEALKTPHLCMQACQKNGSLIRFVSELTEDYALIECMAFSDYNNAVMLSLFNPRLMGVTDQCIDHWERFMEHYAKYIGHLSPHRLSNTRQCLLQDLVQYFEIQLPKVGVLSPESYDKVVHLCELLDVTQVDSDILRQELVNHSPYQIKKDSKHKKSDDYSL